MFEKRKHDHDNSDCNDAEKDDNDNDMGLFRNGAFPLFMVFFDKETSDEPANIGVP